MRIAFVSTILSYPWGGADFLWTRAAEAAADGGDSLLLSLSPDTAAHPRIVALQSRGARLHLRTSRLSPPPLARRLWARLRPPVYPLLSALRASVCMLCKFLHRAGAEHICSSISFF